MDEVMVAERLAALEQNLKAVNRRLDKLDDLDNLGKLTENVHIMAEELKQTRENVAEMRRRVSDIEDNPRRRWETVVAAVITAVIGGLIGFFMK